MVLLVASSRLLSLLLWPCWVYLAQAARQSIKELQSSDERVPPVTSTSDLHFDSLPHEKTEQHELVEQHVVAEKSEQKSAFAAEAQRTESGMQMQSPTAGTVASVQPHASQLSVSAASEEAQQGGGSSASTATMFNTGTALTLLMLAGVGAIIPAMVFFASGWQGPGDDPPVLSLRIPNTITEESEEGAGVGVRAVSFSQPEEVANMNNDSGEDDMTFSATETPRCGVPGSQSVGGRQALGRGQLVMDPAA